MCNAGGCGRPLCHHAKQLWLKQAEVLGKLRRGGVLMGLRGQNECRQAAGSINRESAGPCLNPPPAYHALTPYLRGSLKQTL